MSADRPLAGIRVIDLGWITAGAGTATILSDLGADVIKVEGPGAIDPFRRWDAAESGTDWWNRSPFYNFTNRGKRSLCLDLKDARGHAVMLRLLGGADVVLENFRRGVMESLGLAPRQLRARFPHLVIASISSQGEDGPDRDMVSYGSTLEAMSGLAALTGAGAAPVISGRELNYPDQVVCLFAAGAIIAALHARRQSGLGTHLDLSQRELASFLLGEEFIAAAAGVPSSRRGNQDPNDFAARVEHDGAGWRVVGAHGTAPVRGAAELIAAPEFGCGTAILHTTSGEPAKGVPFRLAAHTLPPPAPCRALGADNHAVLRDAGLTAAEIVALERDGVVADRPRDADP